MQWIEKLEKTLKKAMKEDEFPDFLTEKINKILLNPKQYESKLDLIEELIEQIKDYDAYANAGCFSNSFSAEDIQATLEEIEI
jgi:hypothetical protein